MQKILDFLKELKADNSREWMEANKVHYLDVKQHFEEAVGFLINKISLFDHSITGILPRNCIFRINRDIRFSKDKRPYKENMGAFISPEGKKGVSRGYYFHIEPGSCMIAGGCYMPPPDMLKKIRQEIDYNPGELLRFMEGDDYKKYFTLMEGDRLKTAPRGYSTDHPRINLLRLKSYVVVHNMKDKQVSDPGFLEYASIVFRAMKPLNDYLNMAIND